MQAIFRKLISKLKTVRIRFRRDLRLSRKARIDNASTFEGNNAIGYATFFFSSRIGRGSYIGRESFFYKTSIGRFSCIGNNVRIVAGRHPIHGWISVHPAFFSSIAQAGFSFASKNLFPEYKWADESKEILVSIGSDVWIGDGVSIVDGVTIGDGAVIAAGAVVTKSVQAYSVVGGVPAKVLKNRFSEEEISFLLSCRWWDQSIDWLRKNAASFTNMEDFTRIDGVIKT